MRRQPLTTGAAMVAIALGVGANTAMFTVVNAVLLQLPFEDPGGLVSVGLRRPQGSSAAIPVTQFRTWTGRVDALEYLAGYSMYSPVLSGAGAPDRLRLECASASMFPMLGVVPALGRTFLSQEDRRGAAPVMVASHAFWANRLDGESRSIGRTLTLDGVPVPVIGVMPREFDGPRALRRIDGWIPLSWCLESSQAQERPASTVSVYARLKAGVTPAQARAQMESAIDDPALSQERVRVQLDPLTDQIYGEVREPLLALFGAAAFVLLIACANVASLLIGRADARRRELAMRIALGCSRGRIVRQLLTESLLFAMCGGAVGLSMAYWSLGPLLSMMPGGIRRIDHIAIDGSVLAAAVALSIATALLFGLWPAVYASRVEPGAALKESALLTTPSRRRMRGVVIVAEVALSVALLTGAGLLVKTFLHLRPVNPGFEPEGKLAATISLPRARYADGPAWTAFLENLRQRLARRPDVQAVVATSFVPLSGFVSTAEVQPAEAAASRGVTVYAPHVTPDYHKEMGIPILRGRGFTPFDSRGSGVAIVNETMAKNMWPGQDALGQKVVVKTTAETSTKTIVGVSRNVRDAGQRLTSRAELYLPFADEPVPILRIVVTTRKTSEQMAPIIRQEIAALDPLLPLASDVESLTSMVARSVATWRFAASLLSVFAAIAATLAGVGLFAVVAGWVTERTPEIGVRMALGASPGQVVFQQFLLRAVFLTSLGIACGLALAALTTRFLAAWLVNASPLDRPTFAAAAALMGALCLLATYLPARRAASVDPLVALRYE